MAELISGKTLAAKLKAEAAAEAAELREKGVHARLAVVIVGENPASRTYVAGKAKDCAECGLLSDVIALPEETTEAALLEKIAALNADKTVHGSCRCPGISAKSASSTPSRRTRTWTASPQ